MRDDSLLRHLIVERYTPESVRTIQEVLAQHRTHEIQPVAHGLFAASPSQSSDSVTGYQNVWVRDNIMIANSFRLRGQLAPAIACMRGLTKFFATQVPRFREVIHDSCLKQDASRRPHIRFTAQTLSELPEQWPHAQNDALGLALWFRFLLANSGEMPLTPAETEIFQLFPEYFAAIEYWRDEDSGAWEEGLKVNNSSVGAVVAGLEEMKKCAEFSAVRHKQLGELAAKGRERLNQTLPFEAPPERMVDSALLFLIHPLGVVRNRESENGILNLVQARLKGDIGIKRYIGDSYFCQDYDRWFPPDERSADFSERLDFRDAHLQPNCEAQWCIFDPLLSIIYGQRFLADRTRTEDFRKQVHYFNRSLAQITAAGECPELYFLKNERYIANAHTPLAWTQANQALALHLMEQSVREMR
jgi:hypothetical protein